MKTRGYKDRKIKGADRYGSFREGKQFTPDIIAGVNLMIPFTHLRKN